MSEIVQFPTDFEGFTNPSETENAVWLRGYAAGLADAKRHGSCFVADMLENSGLCLSDLIEAGVDEYDLEDLREELNEIELKRGCPF